MFTLNVSAAAPTPTNIERKTVNGTEYIVKTFNVNNSITAEMLVENDFKTDDFSFTHTNTEKKENISELSKSVSKPATLETTTNSASNILKQFIPSMSYSEDGYYGTLTLDTASLVTQASGYASRNVPVYKTKEYKGLLYNDPSFIPQSILDNGITLSLSSVEWIVTGTALAGDSLVPTEYKAIAQYSGSQRVTYATGYTTTVQYTGIVTKKSVDSITYIITYTGTFIPVPTTEPPTTTEEPTTEAPTTEEITTEPETENEEPVPEHGNIMGYIIGIILAAILIGGATAGYILYMKKNGNKNKKTEIAVYNLINDKYILLGTAPLDKTNLSVNLNQFDASIKSGSFGFALDKYSANVLNGTTVSAAYNNKTLTHCIKQVDKSGEYKFELVFGNEINQ